MPRRSNEFQRLVTLIQRAFAKANARITPSALVETPGGFGVREIDVLIEEPEGTKSIKIAVEAKDEGRRIDLVKLESYIGKYRSKSGLQVDRVVIVSRRGFSRNALKRATAEGIETVILRKSKKVDWSKSIPTKLLVNILPHVTAFQFFPALGVDPRLFVREAHLLCETCGRQHGTPLTMAHAALLDPQCVERMRKLVLSNNGVAQLRIEFAFHSGQRFEFQGQTIQLERFVANVRAVRRQSELTVKQYEYGEDVVHHLTGDVTGEKLSFVLTHGAHSTQIPAQLGTAEPTTEDAELGKPTIVDFVCRDTGFDHVLAKCVDFAALIRADTLRPAQLKLERSGWGLKSNLAIRFKSQGATFDTAVVCLPMECDVIHGIRRLSRLQRLVHVAHIVVITAREATNRELRVAQDYGLRLMSVAGTCKAVDSGILLPKLWVSVVGVRPVRLNLIAEFPFTPPQPLALRIDVPGYGMLDGRMIAANIQKRITERVLSPLRGASFRQIVSQEFEIPFSMGFARGSTVILADGRTAGIHAVEGVAIVGIRAGLPPSDQVRSFLQSGEMPLVKQWKLPRAPWCDEAVMLDDYSAGSTGSDSHQCNTASNTMEINDWMPLFHWEVGMQLASADYSPLSRNPRIVMRP